MIDPQAHANEMYHRLQADLHRKYSELQRLKEFARNDPVVHQYLDAWENHCGFRSFEEMLISLAVELVVQKQRYEKLAREASMLQPLPPIHLQIDKTKMQSMLDSIHGGTRE